MEKKLKDLCRENLKRPDRCTIDDTDTRNLKRTQQTSELGLGNNSASEKREVCNSGTPQQTVPKNCMICFKTSNQECDSVATPADLPRLARCSFCFRRLLRRCCFVVLVFTLYWASVVLLDDGLPAYEDPDVLQDALKDWVVQNEALLLSEYKARAETAKTVCDALGLHASRHRSRKDDFDRLHFNERVSLRRVNWEYMYWARREGLLYCKVPKSGSSTWVYNLLKLAGVPSARLKSDIGLHKMLRDFYPRPRRRDRAFYRRSLKLLVVRHPFDRILSAYRDKLESYERDLLYRNGYYHKTYGRDIVGAHRNLTDPSHGNRSEPTWQEFVRYLVSTPTSLYDEHWRPIHQMCSPCVMKYDVIAKMETFSEDTQYVINKLKLERRLSVEWIHASGSSSSAEIADAYYSQLHREEVMTLYEKYFLDFELFGYDASEHLRKTRT